MECGIPVTGSFLRRSPTRMYSTITRDEVTLEGQIGSIGLLRTAGPIYTLWRSDRQRGYTSGNRGRSPFRNSLREDRMILKSPVWLESAAEKGLVNCRWSEIFPLDALEWSQARLHGHARADYAACTRNFRSAVRYHRLEESFDGYNEGGGAPQIRCGLYLGNNLGHDLACRVHLLRPGEMPVTDISVHRKVELLATRIGETCTEVISSSDHWTRHLLATIMPAIYRRHDALICDRDRTILLCVKVDGPIIVALSEVQSPNVLPTQEETNHMTTIQNRSLESLLCHRDSFGGLPPSCLNSQELAHSRLMKIKNEPGGGQSTRPPPESGIFQSCKVIFRLHRVYRSRRHYASFSGDISYGQHPSSQDANPGSHGSLCSPLRYEEPLNGPSPFFPENVSKHDLGCTLAHFDNSIMLMQQKIHLQAMMSSALSPKPAIVAILLPSVITLDQAILYQTIIGGAASASL
nr:hypothetical protein CFP56_12934 [Quercus suber]